MPLGTNAELDFMLRDVGVPVSLGASSTYGIFSRDPIPEADPASGGLEVPNVRVTLRIRPGTLGAGANAPKSNPASLPTVNGAQYRVRHVGKVEDDGLQTIELAEV